MITQRFPNISPQTRARLRDALRGTSSEQIAMLMREPGKQPIEAAPTFIVPDQFALLLDALYQIAGDWQTIPFLAQNVIPALPLRPAEKRAYLFIQNQSAVNQMVVGFGRLPSATGLNPVDGLVIPGNFGFFEPLKPPQKEIWVRGSAANTSGLLIQATF